MGLSDDTLPICDMPAVKELVTNPALFRCVVGMLMPQTTLPGVSLGAQSGSSFQIKHGRKRSPSEDSSIQSRKKPMTPTPGGHQKQPSNLPASVTHDIGSDADGNLHALGSTVLYSVLQLVDHWPIQIMKAFAVDSFGGRTWVDDDRCRGIVSNLAKSLERDSDEVVDESLITVADEVERYFSSLKSQTEKSCSKACLATVTSAPKVPSSKEKRKQSMPTESSDEPSSSSGEEEVLETETTSTKVDSTQSSSPLSPLDVIFKRSSLSKETVRSRYIGYNLDLADEAISDALSERLSSKSKQNTGLLRTLPSFTCIPRVRCLVSRHLERWLQSPALAQLARELFSQIVRQLRNVEPLLPDDAEAIDNILQMNLKANQVSVLKVWNYVLSSVSINYNTNHLFITVDQLPMHLENIKLIALTV
eukprot:scaffold1540_cov194-Alexandrium_tamarense.AAC.20